MTSQTPKGYFFKGRWGPPGTWKGGRGGTAPVPRSHNRSGREAAMIQTALLIIDMTVSCSTVAPLSHFWGSRGLCGPIEEHFVAECFSGGDADNAPHYALINNVIPEPSVGFCVC